MSKKRNSVFSDVVPVLGTAQTTAPIPLGAKVVSRYSANAPTADPTIRYSTGSTLLDSFVQDAEYSAFALQTELTTLSLELKRIADPRIRSKSTQNPAKTLPNSAVQAKRKAIAQARRQAQQEALKALQQAKQLTQHQAQLKGGIAPNEIRLGKTGSGEIGPNGIRPNEIRPSQTRASEARVSQARASEIRPSKKRAGGAKLGTPKSSAVKVYGGADYKAMQARAQAGGLVNLEDDLLFGGAEKSATTKGRKAASGRFELDLLSRLSQPLEDFTASSIPGGWHPTAHLDESKQSTNEPYQTVVGIDDFKLSDLEGDSIEENSKEKKPENLSEAERCGDELSALGQLRSREQAEIADLDALGKQVSYLNQRIEFLSRKLAAMTGAGATASRSDDCDRSNHYSSDHSSSGHSSSGYSSSSKHGTVSQPYRSSVILRLSGFDTVEEGVTERRVATLESLGEAL